MEPFRLSELLPIHVAAALAFVQHCDNAKNIYSPSSANTDRDDAYSDALTIIRNFFGFYAKKVASGEKSSSS